MNEILPNFVKKVSFFVCLPLFNVRYIFTNYRNETYHTTILFLFIHLFTVIKYNLIDFKRPNYEPLPQIIGKAYIFWTCMVLQSYYNHASQCKYAVLETGNVILVLLLILHVL
jgi:hypothetical protein